MTKPDEAKPDVQALRERISSLNATILRINSSLDVDTALSQAVNGARALTDANYGVIVTADESGRALDFVTSGFTDEEYRRMKEWPDGPALFANLNSLAAPLRLLDVHAWIHSLGYSGFPVPCGAFQATPMRYHGDDVGGLFLGVKPGGFTEDDEEIMALFASQAALAIVNARAHHEERRTRAHLEALVETSPVGVVVFDARTSRLLSLNREARRIAESLRKPGHSPEHLLEVIVCRRADGTEMSLSDLPIKRQLLSGETVRAEEMELFVPDGRRLRTLVNSTPIHSADGAVESVVVTLQDLTPLEEVERMRAEFLGTVSHELRAPLSAIKGSAVTLFEESAALDPTEMREFHRIIVDQANHMRSLIGDLLDTGRIEAGTLSVVPEPSELVGLVEQARNTFLGSGTRHTVLIDMPGDLPWVMADRRRIVQVLSNLFSNAAMHAPESSPIRVTAACEGAHVAVSVSDEGLGIAPEQLAHIFRKYSGTRKDGTLGHGLGLAICKGLVEAHGGRIRAESAGHTQGTTFTFTVPMAGTAEPDPSAEAPKKPDPTRILVVDDDPNTLRFVRHALSTAGFVPLVAGDGHDFSRIVRTERPQLILLDLMLPDVDGIELMQQLPEFPDLPVIFISAYGRDETVSRALEAGATDYIVKPFSSTELVARIRAALRGHEESGPFVLGELMIDYGSRRTSVAGCAVELTPTEYELLRMLSLNAGRVVTYDTLLRQVWNGRRHASSNLVRIFVRNLRLKLGDSAANPAWIFNERGVGYLMPRPDKA